MNNTKFLKGLLAVVEKQQAAIKKLAQSGLKGDPLDFDAVEKELGANVDSKNYGRPGLKGDPLDFFGAEKELGAIVDSKGYNKPRPAPAPALAPANKQTIFNDVAMGEKIKQELKSPDVFSVGVHQGSGLVTVKFNPSTPTATKDQLFKTLKQVAGRYVGNATVQEVV